jgi:tetratricopeptide (TPR) repeat protein
MTLEPYSPCPCGSGKKFKWCCQQIYGGIQHALDLYASGQRDAAERALDQVAKEHPNNPEVWGRKAELLFADGKTEEAEEVLAKAFALNPNYPAGLLLRARVRFMEGEMSGALLLARRAADAFDPEAHDYLADVYRLIFECEWRRNRPVAARAAMQLVTKMQPADEEVRAVFDQVFLNAGRLPASARREYSFRPCPHAAGERRAAWDKALASLTGRLSDAAKAFELLAKVDPNDGPAHFNLAIGKAWLGDNKAALEALDRYLDLERDEAAAEEAATLAEVLRCGEGLEDEGDYRSFFAFCQIRDPERADALLNDWAESRRLIVLQSPEEQQQQGVFRGLLLETSASSLVTAGRPAADAARLAGYVTITGDMFQLHSPLEEPFNRLREEVRSRLTAGLNELKPQKTHISFHDVIADALLFPFSGNAEEAKQKVLEHVQRHYEDKWIHQPRRVLGNVAPVEAVGSTRLRKKLRGVVRFIQEVAAASAIKDYDFDRLRRKLGLIESGPGSPSLPAAGDVVHADIPALGAAELAGLPISSLSDAQLEQAYQTAHRLNAEELTANFARALVARPGGPGKPDRFPWYSYLVQKALKDGALDAALDLVNEGEKADCENNEGHRRNDYELRRAQVHVKRGEADAAHDVFQRLVERVPENLRFRGQAAEAMLGLKQGSRALRFAEEGVAAARKANDRDNEQYLMELLSAAKKQTT